MTSVHDSYEIDLLPSLRVLDAVEVRCAQLEDGCEDPEVLNAVFVPSEGEVPACLPNDWDRQTLEAFGFVGTVGDTLMVPSSTSPQVYVGIGDDPGEDDWRGAGAALARARAGFGHLRAVVPEVADVEALVEGVLLGQYEYHAFKSQDDSDASLEAPLRVLELALAEAGKRQLAVARKHADRARSYARAAYVARDLTNAPPAHLNPGSLEKCALRLGDQFGFAVETIDGVELAEMGCGGIVGVNRGSEYAARLIKLRLHPEGAAPSAPAVSLVGKGITFDSGGLSLKPAASMLTMKSDMGGAAAILGAFSALPELDLTGPVEGWLPVTDNMISGDSLRVGEVITARNGTTVEVTNTDAEGRLILMDALAMAAEQQPKALIDIATLTGAQIVALGNDVAAIMGNDEKLLDRVERAADASGEDVWELPLYEGYRRLLRSDIADLVNANLSERSAGSIVAGLFLSNFVGDTPWVHIDIAGPSFGSKESGYQPVGATGFGARLLARLVVDDAS